MAREYHRELQFINVRDQDSRELTRRHVTREYYREKRWLDAYGPTSNKQGDKDYTAEDVTPDFVISVLRLNPRKKRTRKRSKKTKALSALSDVASEVPKPEPLSMLGAGRVDPFSAYPIEADSSIHHLIDHYLYVLPSTLHSSHVPLYYPLPIHHIFNIFRQDSASFLILLHHSAQHLTILRGSQNESRAVKYRYHVLQLVQQQIASQHSKGHYSDHLIMTVALLANAERLYGSPNTAKLHWAAVTQMVISRGGFSAFVSNHVVHILLVWAFISISGPWPESNPAYMNDSANVLESTAPENQSSWDFSDSLFSSSCSELVSLVTRRRSTVLTVATLSDAERHAKEKQYPNRHQAFKFGGSLMRALTRQTKASTGWRKLRALENCRIACLLNINVVLDTMGDFSYCTELYMSSAAQWVNSRQRGDVDCGFVAEHLLWCLVEGLSKAEMEEHNANAQFPTPSGKRLWQLMRLVGVMKMASEQTRQDVEEVLRLCLLLPNDEDGTLRKQLEAWDEQAFRQGIMKFPDEVSEIRIQRREATRFPSRHPLEDEDLPTDGDITHFSCLSLVDGPAQEPYHAVAGFVRPETVGGG